MFYTTVQCGGWEGGRDGKKEKVPYTPPPPFCLIKGAFLAPDRHTQALKQFWESVVTEYCLLGSGKKPTGHKAALELWAWGLSFLKVTKAPESPCCITRMFCSSNTSQAWFPATRMYSSDKGTGGLAHSHCLPTTWHSLGSYRFSQRHADLLWEISVICLFCF